MDLSECLAKIEKAGFQIAIEGDSLTVAPASNLTDSQRRWIRDHKPAILDHLRSTAAVLEAGQPGNDLPAANDMAQPIMVEAFTPLGGRMLVRANSAEHAAWIRKMNPPPRRSS